jgi:hypothetical protein
MMEATRSSRISIHTKATRRHILEDAILKHVLSGILANGMGNTVLIEPI